MIISGQLGLPLDDSWIHQTLSRNLAQTGSLWINPGETTSATTSFLWTLVLAFGYKLGLEHLPWAYTTGLISYVISAWLIRRVSLVIIPEAKGIALLAAVLLLLDWHLAWAAVSGMETMLFTMVSVLLVYLTVRKDEPSPLVLGLAGSVAMLARPEGGALFALSLVFLWFRRVLDASGQKCDFSLSIQRETRRFLAFLLPASVVFLLLSLPYWAINYWNSGSPIPSTFQAKNAYYGQGFSSVDGLFRYLANATVTLFVGPLLLVLPGVMYMVAVSVRRLLRGATVQQRHSSLSILLLVVWVGLLWLMYFAWLPVPHLHHGRYLMPSIPFLLLLGLAGSAELLRQARIETWLPRLRLVLLAFSIMWLVVGAEIYACNVKFIQDNQVAAALWVRDNISLGGEVAAHDIGAMGYFSGRKILDTVGLITPELNYRPGNEAAVVSLMRQCGVDTMALFPSWHPWVLENKDFTEIARMGGRCLFSENSEEMIVMHVIAK